MLKDAFSAQEFLETNVEAKGIRKKQGKGWKLIKTTDDHKKDLREYNCIKQSKGPRSFQWHSSFLNCFRWLIPIYEESDDSIGEEEELDYSHLIQKSNTRLK